MEYKPGLMKEVEDALIDAEKELAELEARAIQIKQFIYSANLMLGKNLKRHEKQYRWTRETNIDRIGQILKDHGELSIKELIEEFQAKHFYLPEKSGVEVIRMALNRNPEFFKMEQRKIGSRKVNYYSLKKSPDEK